MKDLIKVKYLYGKKINTTDLMCELTEKIDTYKISNVEFGKTYLYNDLKTFSNPPHFTMLIRFPRCHKR